MLSILLQTYMVYIILFLIMWVLCADAVRSRNWNRVLLALLAYAVVFGVRYGVGVDSLSYMDMYEMGFTKAQEEDIEIGYKVINNVFSGLGLHYSFLFAFLAFTQLFCIFSMERKNPAIWPFLTFVFMIGCYWLTFSNGIRQIMAFCLFAYSIPYLHKKQYWEVVLLWVLAFLFHKSAVLLIPLYLVLIFTKEWVSNIWIQLGLMSAAFMLSMGESFSTLVAQFDTIIGFVGYDNYLDNTYADKFYDSIELGVGFYVNFLINVIIIAFSKKVKAMYSNSWYPRIYNLYFVGVIFGYLVLGSQILGRVNYYFAYFGIIVAAHTLRYLYSRRKTFYYALVGLYCFVLVGTLRSAEYNTSMFYTFWQKDIYVAPKEK